MHKHNTSVDLIHGPIMKSLILFMIPIFISNAFQQLYNAADTAIVGNVLGESSLAAVGACSSIFELMVGFACSLGAGFGIVAARAYGSGNSERIKKAAAGSIVIGGLTAILITVISMIGLKPLLILIQTPSSILEESYSYISIIGAWIIVMFAYNFMSSLLRAVGNSVMPLVFLVFSSVLNIFLDYALIVWFNMGVAGAAAATVISQGVSAVLCLIYMIAKTKELIPLREDFRFDREMYADLAGQGYSMAIMGSIVSVGSIVLQSGINSLGEEIIAGHISARKIYAVCNLPFTSMGIALSTFIGQNRGAENGERILKAVKDCIIFDFAAAGIVSVFLWTCAPALIHMISGSENTVILNNGSRFLYVVGPFYAVLGVLMQLRFTLQGLGSKIMPLISSVIEFTGKIMFTIFLIPRFQYDAVIWCEPIIWCVMTVWLIYCYVTNDYVKKTKEELKAAA